MSNISSNLETVRQQIAEAALRRGRTPEAVTIIAVTKTRSVQEVQDAVAAGVTHLAENRVQELKEKWPQVQGATWHLVGSLQTNKVKPALEMADLIHSLDREALAAELARQAERRGRPCEALVQVNVSGEQTKHGVSPEGLIPLLRVVSALGWIRVRGLMTMAPWDDDPERVRPHFRRLRELSEQARALGLANITMDHLSMGMSGDFTTAVEEGATMVRIGTAIFGERGQ